MGKGRRETKREREKETKTRGSMVKGWVSQTERRVEGRGNSGKTSRLYFRSVPVRRKGIIGGVK